MTDDVPQQQLVTELGIGLPHLRKLRSQLLIENVDWRQEGITVWYTPSAAEKMRGAVLAPAASAVLPPPVVEAAPSAVDAAETVALVPDDVSLELTAVLAPAAPRRVRVVSQARDILGIRKHFANPGIIRCEFLDGGGLVWVRVKHSRNYCRKTNAGEPMEFEVQIIGNNWVPTRRDPRFPGRW